MIAIGVGASKLATATGDTERLSKGKRMLKWAVVGLIIVLMARVLVVAAGRFVGADIPLTGGPADTAPPPECG